MVPRRFISFCAAVHFLSVSSAESVCSTSQQSCRFSSFCNFDDGASGFCEACSNVLNDNCYGKGLPDRGATDCLAKCQDYSECFRYITTAPSSPTELGTVFPKPVQCRITSIFNFYGPLEHQALSCCDRSGHTNVQQGLVGGFDTGVFQFSSLINATDSDVKCAAYSSALSLTLCDPRQGEFIRKTTNETTGQDSHVLRVCASSCDAVYQACGPPGNIFPENRSFVDGASTCQDLWGGWESVQLEVVEDNLDCLELIIPSDLNAWSETNGCGTTFDSDFEPTPGFIFNPRGLYWLPLSAVFIAYSFYEAKRRKRNRENENENNNSNTERTDHTATLQTEQNEESNNYSEYSQGNNNPEASVAVLVDSPESLSLASLVVEANSNTIPIVPSLASYMEKSDSFDKRESVNKWMRSYPMESSILTPHDVAEALSKITFSLDQSAVAADIAKGMSTHGGSVTCQHIIAAMGACKNSEADVAKEMAPYASDPQNKDQVVSKIPLTFQRNDVENRFMKV
eukprot:scaffold421226_cov55-Attheya_sp.AAC.2